MLTSLKESATVRFATQAKTIFFGFPTEQGALLSNSTIPRRQCKGLYLKQFLGPAVAEGRMAVVFDVSDYVTFSDTEHTDGLAPCIDLNCYQ